MGSLLMGASACHHWHSSQKPALAWLGWGTVVAGVVLACWLDLEVLVS